MVRLNIRGKSCVKWPVGASSRDGWPLRLVHRLRCARTPRGTYSQTVAAGWSSSVARWAHNPEVASSNLAPATRQGPQINLGAFVLCGLGSGPRFQRDLRYLACVGGLWGGRQAYVNRIDGIARNTGLNIRNASRSNGGRIGRNSRGVTSAYLVCSPLIHSGRAGGERCCTLRANEIGRSWVMCIVLSPTRTGMPIGGEEQGLARMHPQLIRARREG